MRAETEFEIEKCEPGHRLDGGEPSGMSPGHQLSHVAMPTVCRAAVAAARARDTQPPDVPTSVRSFSPRPARSCVRARLGVLLVFPRWQKTRERYFLARVSLEATRDAPFSHRRQILRRFYCHLDEPGAPNSRSRSINCSVRTFPNYCNEASNYVA